jgi:hypothetical protein
MTFSAACVFSTAFAFAAALHRKILREKAWLDDARSGSGRAARARLATMDVVCFPAAAATSSVEAISAADAARVAALAAACAVRKPSACRCAAAAADYETEQGIS